MIGVLSIFLHLILVLEVYGQGIPTCASFSGSSTSSCSSPLLEIEYCPKWYKRMGDQCYKASRGKGYWERSRRRCEAVNTNLAEPYNILYNSTEFVKYLWKKGGTNFGFKGRTFIIGGIFKNNEWKWLSGQKIISNNKVNTFYGGECLSLHVTKTKNVISYQFQSIPCKPSKDMIWARKYRHLCQVPILKGYEPCYRHGKMYPSGQLVSMNAQQCQQHRCLNGKIDQFTCGNVTTGCCEYKDVLYGEGDIIEQGVPKNCSTCEQRVCKAGVIQWQACANCPIKCCFMNGESYQPGSQIESGSCSRLVCDGTTGDFINQGYDPTCQTCKVYLDPHIVTYDSSSVYSYQKCGNYTLSQFGTSYEPPTAVYGNFVPCSGAFCLDSITFKNDEHTVITIGYDVNTSSINILVNGSPFRVTSYYPSVINVMDTTYFVQAWKKSGSCVALEGSSGIMIKFCGSSGGSNSAYLWASPVIAGELRGLCGTVNNNVDDDLTSRDGNITSSWSRNPPMEFTTSWMVSNIISDDCTINQTKNHCSTSSSVENHFRSRCRSTIKNLYANVEHEDVEALIDACVFGLCAVDDPEDWLRVVRETTQVQADILEGTLIFKECEMESSQNGTYFINKKYPEPYDGVGSCKFTIKKMNANICQLRLDFDEMVLAQPDSSNHQCLSDRFMVSGTSSNTPTICGTNTGHHMYVNMDPKGEDHLVLSVITLGPSFSRKWKIKVSQIPCNAAFAAPNHCLQYFQTGSGTIKSFNFNVSSGLQLSNQDYTICVRSDRYFCGIEYNPCEDKVNAISQSFTLSGNANRRRGLLAGSRKCFNDWLTIPCVSNNSTHPWSNCVDRLCGDFFNIAPSDIAGNVPLYSYVKPFRLVYHTDGFEINSTSSDKGNKGFCLDYVQKPCF